MGLKNLRASQTFYRKYISYISYRELIVKIHNKQPHDIITYKFIQNIFMTIEESKRNRKSLKQIIITESYHIHRKSIQ